MKVRVEFWLEDYQAVAVIAKVLAQDGKVTLESVRKEAREVFQGHGYNWSDGFDIGSTATEEQEQEAWDIYERYRDKW